jgi:hypothetical protein
MTVFASMYVTMQWTLDALGQVAPEPDETLPTNRYRRTLERMSHLATLLQQARVLESRDGVLVPVDTLPSDAEARMARSRALEPVSSLTWWNAMLVIAMPLASIVGLRVAGPHSSGLTVATGFVAVLGAAATILAYGGDSTIRMPWSVLTMPSPARALLTVGITSATIGVVASMATAGVAGWIAPLPTVLVGGVYAFFRHASRTDVLLDPAATVRTVAVVLARVRDRVFGAVVGPDAPTLLNARSSGGGTAPGDSAGQ